MPSRRGPLIAGILIAVSLAAPPGELTARDVRRVNDVGTQIAQCYVTSTASGPYGSQNDEFYANDGDFCLAAFGWFDISLPGCSDSEVSWAGAGFAIAPIAGQWFDSATVSSRILNCGGLEAAGGWPNQAGVFDYVEPGKICAADASFTKDGNQPFQVQTHFGGTLSDGGQIVAVFNRIEANNMFYQISRDRNGVQRVLGSWVDADGAHFVGEITDSPGSPTFLIGDETARVRAITIVSVWKETVNGSFTFSVDSLSKAVVISE